MRPPDAWWNTYLPMSVTWWSPFSLTSSAISHRPGFSAAPAVPNPSRLSACWSMNWEKSIISWIVSQILPSWINVRMGDTWGKPKIYSCNFLSSRETQCSFYITHAPQHQHSVYKLLKYLVCYKFCLVADCNSAQSWPYYLPLWVSQGLRSKERGQEETSCQVSAGFALPLVSLSRPQHTSSAALSLLSRSCPLLQRWPPFPADLELSLI